MAKIIKQTGVTASERLLEALCTKSFLKLWSFPRPFGGHGKRGTDGFAKEICDLIVVFGNDVLLFSDKTCAYKATGNADTDWKRWHRHAVEGSIKQLFGAERWIRSDPEHVYLDAACTQPFPHDLSQPDLRFHRIAVALGASDACKAALGGSGSMMLLVDGTGGLPEPVHAVAGQPFMIHNPGGDKGFVHVFDDVSLPIVLKELDTARDFIDYLTAKEQLAGRKSGMYTPGEEELLSVYIASGDGTHWPNFRHVPDDQFAMFGEGYWVYDVATGVPKVRRRHFEISYAWWDNIIDRFGQHLLNDELWDGGHQQEFAEHERRVRAMASVDRLTRTEFAKALKDLTALSSDGMIRCKMVKARDWSIGLYLIRFPTDGHTEESSYREHRSAWQIANTIRQFELHPQMESLISLAFGVSGERLGASEDLIYLVRSEITDEDRQRSREFIASGVSTPVQNRSRTNVGRNDQCPCGKGKKFKRCCGR